LLMPYSCTHGMRPDAKVVPTGHGFKVICHSNVTGCVLNGLGKTVSTRIGYSSAPPKTPKYSIHQKAPDPMIRKGINQPLYTGINAIDGFITFGKGQRIGVFAAAGTGKTTLMSQIAKSVQADVVVINLLGERGREVKEFLENTLDPETRKRSVVVAATSDQPAIVRSKSAFVATTIAEYFRDHGKNVFLMMDSVTRFARALREIGLARGEIPTRSGYPPSVFAELPTLMERAGTNDKGSITALYTVLVEGDDLNEPVSDEVMSILDGHIILSRKLAAENRYPAIDILRSKSRVMNQVVSNEHRKISAELLSNYALYKANEDAIRFGFYEAGKNQELDSAVRVKPVVDKFMFSSTDKTQSIDDTVKIMKTLVGV
jgi:FliI/YscN family ATPase